MKDFAILMRIMAVVIFGVMFVTTVVAYVTDTGAIEERREELEEDIDDHREEYRREGRDHDDCWECESLDRTENSIDRSAVNLVLSSISNISMHLVFCGILFAAGEISGKLSKSKQDNQYQGQNTTSNSTMPNFMPNATVGSGNTYGKNTINCPRCGNIITADSKHCAKCGAVIYN